MKSTKVGWLFLERTRILSGIQFTTYFIEIFVVETKRFVGSFVNVILTRQTCGQRSSRAAESKRRAIENYFSKHICYMFPISEFRGDRHAQLQYLINPVRWQNPEKKTCFDVYKTDFALALRFSKREYRSCAQT